MKAKITIITLALVALTVLTSIPKIFADDGIQIAYGDHFEMVCRDDGLVDIYHVLLATANITQNVTCKATYSFDGTLEGDISYEYDPEIYEHEILSSSKNGTSMVFVNFNSTLKPLKFTKLKLEYTVEGLLKNVNGTWHFKHSFNSDSVSPPEILLKIPKPPTQFHKLIIEDTIPAPHVFIEETHYYVLVWKSPLFTFGDVSTIYIDVSYKTVWNPESFNVWLILQVILYLITFFVGVVLGYFGRRIWKMLVFKADQTRCKIG